MSHLPAPRCALPTALLLAAVLAGCAGPEGTGTGGEIFREVAAESGLGFVHFNGMSGELYFPEIAGAGGALFDYDGDGDLDLYAVQGTMLGGAPIEAALVAPHHPPPLTDRLYRNDLELGPSGERRLRFTDVTAESGILALGYGMGVATGDYDGDGWTDLYVTNFGPNQLWRNRGPGPDGKVSFEDVTAASGTGDDGWSTSATFLDYDRDGRLDLYVVSYVGFRLANHKTCHANDGRADYCGPLSYAPAPDRLYRNLGPDAEGVTRFEDVSGPAGIHAKAGSGLGVVASDFDGDGWVDVYVANDQMENFLWRGSPEGRFTDQAVLAGAAVNLRGKAEASMGIAADDFDNDGDEDLFLTHLSGETNTLYENLGAGLFEDRSTATQLGPESVQATGFGTAMLDYDNDGWLDVVTANGAVYRKDGYERAESVFPYEQPNMLFRNLGRGEDGRVRFADVTAEAGAAFAVAEVSRGVAVGDVDGDGDTDVVVFNDAGPLRLFVNQVGQDRPWLGLRLLTGEPGRDALGARAVLERRGAPARSRTVRTGSSYCSASDPRLLFGLGDGPEVTGLVVHWSDGRSERFEPPPLGRYTTLRQGGGRPQSH